MIYIRSLDENCDKKVDIKKTLTHNEREVFKLNRQLGSIAELDDGIYAESIGEVVMYECNE